MAEKVTSEQFAATFNAGAAYAVATGDITGGMELVFSQSRDLLSEPIIQRTMAGASNFMAKQREYSEQIKAWENSEDKSEESKPKFEMTQELATAQMHYQELAASSQMRARMFENAYNNMTVNQIGEMVLYGNASKNVPEKIMELTEANGNTVVKDVEKNNDLWKALQVFRGYHIMGNVAKDIQDMQLRNTLEGIIQSKN